MTGTLWDERDRREILTRLGRMTPDAVPQWGRMDAARMIVHVTDALLMAIGDLRCAPVRTPLMLPVIKRLVMFHLPWPRGARTAPELLVRTPERWTDEMTALTQALDRFVARSPAAAWPSHPFFGRLSGTEWGRFMYRHLSYHLTQFGV